MYLYNDCMYLAENLRSMLGDQSLWSSQNISSVASKLEPDITAVEKFGKLAYGREMESQRRVIRDLLDGAQGFTNCSEYPFSSECETAISSVVDWMRTLNTEWKAVLSHSALLQSMGSLLATVINKMIVDIEDMNDISEPESQRLAGFCGQVSKLEDLFVPNAPSEDHANGQETPVPLTALYTTNWLKFQYLSNILESSLADIKYLWTDGELQLELSQEEVTDLIEALFADSEHRRRAIGEIRRTSRTH
jgi:protein transport protein DSL1/ZW10